MTKKRLLSSILCPALVLSMTACSGTSSAAPEASASTPTVETTSEAPAAAAETASADTAVAEEETKAPKYVFLFIGDGMSYPQFQSASDYLGAVADDDYENALPSTEYDTRNGAVLDGPVRLNFMDFAVEGSAITYKQKGNY